MKYFILTFFRQTNGNYVSKIADNDHLYEIDRIFCQSDFLSLTREQASTMLSDSGYTAASIAESGEPTFNGADGNNYFQKWYYFAFDSRITSRIEKAMRSIGWRKCDDCGAWIEPQNIRNGLSAWHADEQKRRCPVCEKVWKRLQPKIINLCHYHENQRLWRVINAEGEDYRLNNVKGIGIELEVNNSNYCSPRIKNREKMECTDDFFKIADPYMDDDKKIFFCEKDCTVAAEIISNVFTEKAWNAFDLSVLTEQAKFVGNDENTPSVGLHYHLSHTWLGDSVKAKVASYAKILYFVNAYQQDFEKLSKRIVGNISRIDAFTWCSFYSKSQILDVVKRASRAIANGYGEETALSCFETRHGDTGCAVIKSKDTIEFRIFHSTNDPKRIKQIGKFLIGLCQGLAKVSPSKCLSLGKAFKFVPDDIKSWLHSQGLFLNSLAVAENGGKVGMTAEEIEYMGL